MRAQGQGSLQQRSFFGKVPALRPFAAWVGGLLFLGVLAPSWAEAAVQLQKVQVSDGSRVDLVFDGALDPAQLTTEYFNDIVQISFNETNVYPAKILSVSGRDLAKVFAYQYAPGLVRCRFTVKGRAEDYKDRLSINTSGRILSVKFGAAGSTRVAAAQGSASVRNDSDSIRTSAARPVSAGRGGEGADESSGMTADEKQLLQRVLQGGKSAKSDSGKSGSSQSGASGSSGSVNASSRGAISSTRATSDPGQQRLGGAPDLPSPIKPFGYLLAICAGLAAIGIGFKKWVLGGGDAGNRFLGHRSLTGFLSRIGMPVAPRDRRNLIEVLATHPLGQKKSLAIVRVGGVRMVLGVSDESINLISRLGTEDDAEDAAMESGVSDDAMAGAGSGAGFGNPAFEDAIAASLLGNSPAAMVEKSGGSGRGATAAGRPAFSNVLNQEARRQGARDQIRNRLGNMKPL